MTEFRKFCIGFFVGVGLISTLGNRGIRMDPQYDNAAGLILWGVIFGCLMVMAFGDRR